MHTTVHKMDFIHHNHFRINGREGMTKVINKIVLLKTLNNKMKDKTNLLS